MLPPPAYTLETPPFRFRALAALAGRTALGGGRESVLATLLAARLAAGLLPPDSLSEAQRAARARAAKGWLSSLTLPAALRTACTRLVDASGGASPSAVAAALERVRDAGAKTLDPPSVVELQGVERALKGMER